MLAFLGIDFISFTWIDFLDVILVSFLFFIVYNLVKKTIALKILIGLIMIYSFYLTVKAIQMDVLTGILAEFINVGLILAIILFQQEIKKFLILITQSPKIGENRLIKLFLKESPKQRTEFEIPIIIDTVQSLSTAYTGALLIIGKKNSLHTYVETGEYIDSRISKSLLLTIFFKNTPLHDGAVIVYRNKIIAAGCILPVSPLLELPVSCGLRHRAAASITEIEQDVIAIVVSEESGNIALSYQGNIYFKIELEQLKKVLTAFFYDPYKILTALKK